MQDSQLNSPQYISETLEGQHNLPERRKFFLSVLYSTKTLIYGRKWLVYFLLTLIPLLTSLVSANKYLGQETATDAFIDNALDTVLFFLFSFGALLISLPHTSDEITDNVMEGYVVRPIRRETIFLSRSLVSILGIFIINCIIATIYYGFFHVIDGFNSTAFFDNINLLVSMFILYFFGALVYGTLFTFVGVIGNRGFTFGALIAVVESFLLSQLFLQNSPSIPRTNFQRLADELLGSFYSYDNVSNVGVFDTIFYFIAFAFLMTLIGIYYFKNRQFDG